MNIMIEFIDADLSKVDPLKVEELKSSITTIGTLLHPITVRTNGDRFDLVAGRARLKAFIELGRSEIPCSVEEEHLVTPLEIAIHENLMRYNLPWWEQVDLELKLHELRQEQFGKKKIGRNASKSGGWSQEDTARELGIALGAMSQDIFLANAIRRNPNLMKVADKMTALKLAKEAARRESIESESLIPSNFELNQVLCGDSSIILKEIPAETFNVCITDPPWMKYQRDESLTKDETTLPVFKEVFRVLRRDSLLYMIVSTTDFSYYQVELPKFGFVTQEYPLIWDKGNIISHGKRSWEYGRSFELILLAAKGNPVLFVSTQLSPIFSITPVQPTRLRHPHEKPLKLIEEIIKHSTFDEGKILDPFAGSGAVLHAAKKANRPYLGIERDYHFYEKIQRRLENVELGMAKEETGEL